MNIKKHEDCIPVEEYLSKCREPYLLFTTLFCRPLSTRSIRFGCILILDLYQTNLSKYKKGSLSFLTDISNFVNYLEPNQSL